MTQPPAQGLSPSVLPRPLPCPQRLQLVLPEPSQGAGEKEPEDLAQDRRRFWCHRADTLNNLSTKGKNQACKVQLLKVRRKIFKVIFAYGRAGSL